MNNNTMENSIKEKNYQELESSISSGEVDTVIVAFPDQFGQLLGKRLTGDFFLHHSQMECCNYLLSCDIEMEPQQGFSRGGWDGGYGDLHVRVDLSSLTYPAWLDSTALLLGDLVDSEGREVPESPRAVLKEQYRRMKAAGFEPMMASELEFYLFDNDFRRVSELGSGGLSFTSPGAIDYHILGTGYQEEFIASLRNNMNGSGIPVESSKGETGRGQYEIALEYAPALQMADRHGIYKYGAKAMAAAMGRSVSFMAKYSSQDAGSSCHIHSSLFDPAGRENLFATGEESPLFRRFLGGQLALARELFLFFAPTVNSYKRYCPDSFAPTRIAWDYDNRTTAFRVVGKGPNFRIENRLPGADANPYLAYAAVLAAGLYGIEGQIDAGPRFKGDAYSNGTLPQLPQTLGEAAEALDGSTTARKLFGDAVIDHYVRHARMEWERYRGVVDEWELKRYFEKI